MSHPPGPKVASFSTGLLTDLVYRLEQLAYVFSSVVASCVKKSSEGKRFRLLEEDCVAEPLEHLATSADRNDLGSGRTA